MLKAYKYRIYPNNEQKIQIAKTFGCCRFVSALGDGAGFGSQPVQSEKKCI